MTKLSDIIQELKDEGSTNKKVEILQREKDNKDLYALFKATLDSMLNFYIRGTAIQNDPFSDNDVAIELNAEIINEVVDILNGRKLTGNAARAWVSGTANTLFPEDQELLRRMLNRDLECKVSEGLIKRVWPEMLKEYPVLLASKFDEKTDKKIRTKYKGKFTAQLKADGGRCNALVKNGVANFYSRNGKPLLMHGVFDGILQAFDGYMIDGELLVLEDGKIENRQTGNGIFNKAVRETISKSEAESFHFVLWDMVPLDKFEIGKDMTPYKERFAMVQNKIDANQKKISAIESEEFDTFDEALAFCQSKIDQKQEGGIIKMEPLYWQGKRSSDQVKIKAEETGDFLCTGVKPHSKRPELIGSLDFQTDDGKVVFNCGSGLLDEDRIKDPSEFIGKIFEVQYNSIIKSKTSDTYALFLPVKPRIRLDKDKANVFEELK